MHLQQTALLVLATATLLAFCRNVVAWNASMGRGGLSSLRTMYTLRSSIVESTRAPCGARQRLLTPSCALERLPRRTLKHIVPRRINTEKYVACFGQTAAERQGKIIEAIGLTNFWCWAGYFASRTVLGPSAWLSFITVAILRVVLGPVLRSFRMTSELWGGHGKRTWKTRGALFSGRVAKVGYTFASEESDQRTHFQMLVRDEEGRELFFDVPQIPAYRDIKRGMECEVVIFSRSRAFSSLTGVTDAYIPALGIFVGKFPFLKKRAFWKLLRARDERDRYGLEATNVRGQVRREVRDEQRSEAPENTAAPARF